MPEGAEETTEHSSRWTGSLRIQNLFGEPLSSLFVTCVCTFCACVCVGVGGWVGGCTFVCVFVCVRVCVCVFSVVWCRVELVIYKECRTWPGTFLRMSKACRNVTHHLIGGYSVYLRGPTSAHTTYYSLLCNSHVIVMLSRLLCTIVATRKREPKHVLYPRTCAQPIHLLTSRSDLFTSRSDLFTSTPCQDY